MNQPLNEVVDGFKNKWGFIQCVGAIDRSHIPVSPPALNHTDYYNRKGWYSIIIQAVVDHRYLFRDIICVGCVHDARVFANSGIYKKAIKGSILNEHSMQISLPSFLIENLFLLFCVVPLFASDAILPFQ